MYIAARVLANLRNDVDRKPRLLGPRAPRRPSTTKVGAILQDRYQVEERIGEGSMGRVYRALDYQTNTYCAVKILEPEHFSSPGGVDRFLREAEAARSIGHPNIVDVYAVGERKDKRPYIVMELLEGESLADFLARERTMPPSHALRLGAMAATGLEAAHRAGVVHRDIKPDNLFLIGPVGAPSSIKIVDFGLAKIARVPSDGDEIAGTTQYMAPEQVLDDAVDSRADQYGLGVCLFKALTGHLPFEGPDEFTVLAHQVLSKAPPPSWIAEDLSITIDDVVLTMLRKRPANRFADADVAARALLAAWRGESPPLSPLVDVPDAYEPISENAKLGKSVLQRKLSGG